MIKTIKKLAIFTAISLIITIGTTYAQTGGITPGETTNTPTTNNGASSGAPTCDGCASALKNLTECINLPAGQQNYITTIIEEPLDYNDDSVRDTTSGAITNLGNKKFVSIICFRNTLSFNIKNPATGQSSSSTVAKLATTCSPEGAAKELQYSTNKNVSVAYSCKEVQVLLSKGGTSLIEGYIATIYRWGASMVGIIAVLVIVVSGIQISVSGGDSAAIDSAKGRIIKSLSGIAILFLSGLILYTINPNFFVQ